MNCDREVLERNLIVALKLGVIDFYQFFHYWKGGTSENLPAR